MATIPPHTIQYKPTLEWPKYYQYTEPSFKSIICIHNQTILTLNVRTPHTLQQVLKQTTNTHIDIRSIKPTPITYRVEFLQCMENYPQGEHTTYELHLHITYTIYIQKHPPTQIASTTMRIYGWLVHPANLNF